MPFFRITILSLLITFGVSFQYPFTTITQPSSGNVRVIEPYNKKKSKNNNREERVRPDSEYKALVINLVNSGSSSSGTQTFS